jgi:hypothetical protein
LNSITITTSKTEERVGHLNEYAQNKVFLGAYYFYQRVFSKWFGISYFEFGCMLPITKNTLIGAKLNDIEYSVVSSIKMNAEIPNNFMVYNVFPNPFNASTQIIFSVKNLSLVTITVFNILGQQNITLIHDYLPPGSYNIQWDASSNQSGVYIIEYRINKNVTFKKCLLIK